MTKRDDSNGSLALFRDSVAHRALDLSDSGVVVLDHATRVVFWNDWTATLSFIPATEALGKPLAEVLGQPLDAELLSAIRKALEHSRSSVLSGSTQTPPLPLFLTENDKATDARIHQSVIVKPLDVDGMRGCFLQAHDVSDEIRRKEALQKVVLQARSTKAHVQAVVESTSDGIITFDETGTILEANPAALRIFGLAQERLLGDNLRNLLAPQGAFPDEEQEHAGDRDTAWEFQSQQTELSGRRANGKTFPVDFSVTPMALDGAPRYVGIIRDITDRKQTEERLMQLAQYDELTGLANRSLFRDRLLQALARSKRSAGYIALMFLDLDHFKRVNDTLGHETGDDLLREAANRLLACVRQTDTVARLGGDEFTIILEEARDYAIASKIAAKILTSLSRPFPLAGHEIFVTTSIGIASYPESGEDADTLTQAADTAMYQAKSDGRNNFKFFDPDMNSAAQVRLALEADLRHSIERDEMRLFFQPQVNLRTGRVDGCEALIRWIHPHRGLVPPDDFIPLAEETGIILDIGAWVIREAAAICKTWVDAGFEDMKVAVNISPHQFRQRSIKNIITDAVQSAGLPPKHLELEITEGHLMDNTSESIGLLKELSDRGFTIAMDDFGTGYSSLAYLKQFSLDILKIDRSFVNDLPHDSDAVSICEAIISMAHSLRLDVIAEGVESPEHLEFMQTHGCRYVQGYHVSKPLPGEEFLAWLTNNQQYLSQWGMADSD